MLNYDIISDIIKRKKLQMHF